jgi:hypothetical protein
LLLLCLFLAILRCRVWGGWLLWALLLWRRHLLDLLHSASNDEHVRLLHDNHRALRLHDDLLVNDRRSATLREDYADNATKAEHRDKPAHPCEVCARIIGL